MKNLKRIPIIVVPIIFSIISCQQMNKTDGTTAKQFHSYIIDLSEIKYSDEPQLLSSFVEDIEYVKFSEEPLIPDMWNIHIVEDSTKNIYLDFGSIYKYTSDGKFIKSLFKKGQGPGEIYQKNTPGVYNLDENYVMVNNYGNGYNKYTLDGEFIEQFTDKSDNHNQTLQILAYWKNAEMFYYEENEFPERYEKTNTDGPYFFSVKDIYKDSVIYKLPNYQFNVKGESSGWRVHLPCSPAYRGNIDNSIFWMKPLNVDTIYSTKDWTSISPLYIIKKSDTAADYAWFVRANIGNITKREANKERLGGCWALGTGLLFGYMHSKDEVGIGFCPIDGKAKTYSKLFKNDVDEYCPSIDFSANLNRGTFFQKNNYLYLLVDAANFFMPGAKSPFPDLTEDSNPVLVKLKLKER